VRFARAQQVERSDRSVHDAGIIIEQRIEGGGLGAGRVSGGERGGNASPQPRRRLRHELLQRAGSARAEPGHRIGGRFSFLAAQADPFHQPRQRLLDPQLANRTHCPVANAGVGIIEQMAKRLVQMAVADTDFAEHECGSAAELGRRLRAKKRQDLLKSGIRHEQSLRKTSVTTLAYDFARQPRKHGTQKLFISCETER